MAPVRTPPGWPHLALLLSVLLLSACRSSALSPPASEVQPRPATLKATFVTAWGGVPARGFGHGRCRPFVRCLYGEITPHQVKMLLGLILLHGGPRAARTGSSTA